MLLGVEETLPEGVTLPEMVTGVPLKPIPETDPLGVPLVFIVASVPVKLGREDV